MKKVFGLSRREKRVEKINLPHFPVFTSKKFVILKLPEPSTDSFIQKKRKSLLNFLKITY